MTRTQINIRIPEETKESWERAVEESIEYNNVTHLIELSVRNELEERAGEEVIESVTNTSDVSNGEIMDVVQSVQNQVDELEKRVSRSEEESPMPAVTLAPVFDQIPTQEDKAIGPDALGDRITYANRSEIETLLGTLAARDIIESTEFGGKTMYYRDNE